MEQAGNAELQAPLLGYHSQDLRGSGSLNEEKTVCVSRYMKDSPKLNPSGRTRLIVVIVISLLAATALAVAVPTALLGPFGGALAGY